MPIQQIFNNASIAGIRAPSTDTGRAQAYETFSQVFSHMSNEADKFATKYLNEKNQKAALKAVEQGNFKPVEEKGRSAMQVYNKAGLAAQAAKVDAEIQTGLAEIAARNPRNIEQFSKEAGDLRSQMLDGLDVRIRVAAGNKFDAVMGAAKQNINGTLYKEKLEMDAATLSFSAKSDVEDAKRQAYAGNIENAARLYNSANQKRSGLVAYGRKPEALLDQSEKDREAIVISTYQGEFDRAVALSPKKALQLMGQVRSEGLDENNKDLSTDNRAKLVQWMGSRIKDINAQADRNERLHDKYLKERQEMEAAQYLPMAIEGAMSTADLNEMRDNRQISPSDYTSLYKINDKAKEAADDSQEIIQIEIDSINHSKGDTFYKLVKLAEDGRITAPTFATVWSHINNEKFSDARSSPSFKAASHELEMLFRPEGMLGRYRTGMNVKHLEALRDLEDTAAAGGNLREVIDRWEPIATGRKITPVNAIPAWVVRSPDGGVNHDTTLEKLNTELDSGVISDKVYDRRKQELDGYAK